MNRYEQMVFLEAFEDELEKIAGSKARGKNPYADMDWDNLEPR
jgi:hypothetical protein